MICMTVWSYLASIIFISSDPSDLYGCIEEEKSVDVFQNVYYIEWCLYTPELQVIFGIILTSFIVFDML